MRILVTGAEGYIGSVLVPILLKRGHTVAGLDTGFYQAGCLYAEETAAAPIHMQKKDIRQVTVEDVQGFEAVVHLAELSNDPLGQYNPALTYQINHGGTVALAQLCKRSGVSRFVYTSSCSIYGIRGGEDYKTEESTPCPQTAYARCKVLVERELGAMADAHFSPTLLRNATAYGPSPRMRFDLVLNNLAGFAWTQKAVRMTSDGAPWRPLVHVVDICEAIACVLEAPRDNVHNQVLNVGSTEENYQIRDIAQLIARTFPDCQVVFGKTDGDTRSYRVSFEKIGAQLPGFVCRHNAAIGARELFTLFHHIQLSQAVFEHPAYTRLRQLEYLLSTQQLDDQFFWRA